MAAGVGGPITINDRVFTQTVFSKAEIHHNFNRKFTKCLRVGFWKELNICGKSVKINFVLCKKPIKSVGENPTQNGVLVY